MKRKAATAVGHSSFPACTRWLRLRSTVCELLMGVDPSSEAAEDAQRVRAVRALAGKTTRRGACTEDDRPSVRAQHRREEAPMAGGTLFTAHAVLNAPPTSNIEELRSVLGFDLGMV